MSVKRTSKLKETFRDLKKRNQRRAKAGATTAVREMKRSVPVDIGNLKSTIEQRVLSVNLTGVYAGGVTGKDGTTFVDYSLFVEYGTYKMAAQPFFRPGVDAGKREMNNG